MFERHGFNTTGGVHILVEDGTESANVYLCVGVGGETEDTIGLTPEEARMLAGYLEGSAYRVENRKK